VFRLAFLLAFLGLIAPSSLHAQTAVQRAPADSRPEPITLPGVPAWLEDHTFKQEKFTFVRIKYSDKGNPLTARRSRFGRSGTWATDYPDADLALCRQIEKLTNLKAEPVVLELTDKKLSDFPFIYLCEPGRLQFTEAEVAALRTYVEDGGFLMVDDFWGDEQYESFRKELARVLPKRELVDLPLEHEIFHCVFDLKEKPQAPSISAALHGRAQGITYEGGPDTRQANYRAVFNDAGQMMVLMCHNTDLSDGWERATAHEWYGQEFSAKRAFPMGVNIVFYALTRK
jgi:hypothetical protein